LNAVAEWSHRLMNSAEQLLFRRLGVFAGWFDAQDAIAVFPEVEGATPVLLASLVEQSMVDHQQTPAVRYRLLDTLRAFAIEKVHQAGELETARLKHADHMLALLDHADSAGQTAPRLKLTSMVDDVRAALGTMLRTDPQRALHMSAAMMPIWRFDGRYQEGLAWNELALAAAPELSPQRCRTLFQQALSLIELGRFDEARKWLREAEAIADLPRNEELRRHTLIVRANCQMMAGDAASGLLLGQQAIREFDRPGDEDRLAVSLNHTAISLLALGRLSEGKSHAERALALQPGATTSRMATLDTLAQAHVLLGELQSARELWHEAVQQGVDIGWKNGIPFCLFGLALVAGREGDDESALRLHFVAERLNAELNINYYDPIGAPESELIDQLKARMEPAVVEQIRSESGDLAPETLLQLVKSAG
jgi:tetratricopeptide (TPR) repeat protein